MNRRQWKKNYKKKHGYNPPTTTDVSRALKIVIETVNDMCKVVTEVVRKLPEMLETAKESIRNMSDEEFKEVIERMGDSGTAKAWAYHVRGTGDENNNTDL